MRRTVLSLLLLLVLAAACGGEPDDAGLLPTDDGAATGGAAGACAVGEPDCQDTGPLPSGDQGSPLPPPGDAPSDDGSLSVADVVDRTIDGPFLIRGYVVADDTGARLCEALAESFPPQCGGDALPLDPTLVETLQGLSTEQGVAWSDEPVTLLVELADGVFVAPADG